MKFPPPPLVPLICLFTLCFHTHPVRAQHRLKALPEYERYQKLGEESRESVKSGAVSVEWKDGGKAFEYQRDGRLRRYDGEKRIASDMGAAPEDSRSDSSVRRADRTRVEREWRERPERGRQFPSAVSPNGEMVAFHRNRNLYIGRSAGGREEAVTSDATDRNRLRYGTASWVYGEELYQKSAIWWSTNGRRLAFYKFDESRVPDYFLALDQSKLQSALDVEPYTKAGAPNPQADLLIYDLETKRTVVLDVRDGKGFNDDVAGHYIFAVMWSPDGSELLFHRMDRRQQVLELCAANPDTGKCRVIFHDEWRTGWIDPELATLRFLKDGRRFIRETERTGWRNCELWDLSGNKVADLTAHEFETAGIVRIDEAANLFYYLARSGDNHMKLQLHRTALDGGGDVRLTDPAFHHDVDLAPDGKHFIDVAQTHDKPAATRLINADSGEQVAEIAAADMTKWNELGLKPVELFTFKAADGETELHGMLHFPSNFDETKKWPLLVSVYGGPGTNGARETFTAPSRDTELGYLVVNLDARSAAGRGKRLLDSIYRKLGVAEIDDLAAGIKALAERPYVDGGRVGVYGTSYGGTVSALCLLRHPGIFQAACASSGVMDFRNYDSIYTERYMGLPPENAKGYDAGSPMTYADRLKGSLMIFYGTADNNVHPSNSLQLITALQRAGKSFEVQVGPDQGHVSLNHERMLEFFHSALGAGPK